MCDGYRARQVKSSSMGWWSRPRQTIMSPSWRPWLTRAFIASRRLCRPYVVVPNVMGFVHSQSRMPCHLPFPHRLCCSFSTRPQVFVPAGKTNVHCSQVKNYRKLLCRPVISVPLTLIVTRCRGRHSNRRSCGQLAVSNQDVDACNDS